MNAARLAELEARYNEAAKDRPYAEYEAARDEYMDAIAAFPVGRWPCCGTCGSVEQLQAVRPRGYLCIQHAPCPSADPGV